MTKRAVPGRVSAVESPEIPGAMQCCRWATCQVARYCASGKPHAPNKDLDNGDRCYDHMPYHDGGIETWGVMVANAGRTCDAPKETR